MFLEKLRGLYREVPCYHYCSHLTLVGFAVAVVSYVAFVKINEPMLIYRN